MTDANNAGLAVVIPHTVEIVVRLRVGPEQSGHALSSTTLTDWEVFTMSTKQFEQLEAMRDMAIEQGFTDWAANVQRLIDQLRGAK